ncbi:MAG: sugar phosphate isomerase/epimerase [Planctomycetota bacterium]|nr:sugar phosphate isomerase/epimerase [Planctomycetota bacterium]
MDVAASTDCFKDLSFEDALSRLVDLEYTAVEISIHEMGVQLKPSQVLGDLKAALLRCQSTNRLNVIGYNVDIRAEGEEHYQQFEACCKLAKATKVVTISVPSSELGTPFNEEVEHLKRLTKISKLHGVRVGMMSQIGSLTEDPDTVQVMCDHVDGLGLCLDPSHYICGPYSNRSFSHLMKYVYQVRLRDSKKDQLNVQIGQGEVDYGRLINQLENVNYDHALITAIEPVEGVDFSSEMRKMRLLLESQLF